jgi:cell division protein FtsL
MMWDFAIIASKSPVHVMKTIIQKILVCTALIAGLYLCPSVVHAQAKVYDYRIIIAEEYYHTRVVITSTDSSGKLIKEETESDRRDLSADKRITDKLTAMEVAGYELYGFTNISIGINGVGSRTHYLFRQPKK